MANCSLQAACDETSLALSEAYSASSLASSIASSSGLATAVWAATLAAASATAAALSPHAIETLVAAEASLTVLASPT